MQKIGCFFYILFFFFAGNVHAQTNIDTLELSFPAAEKIFLQHNLSLLAGKYNIDINKALIQQAKLWDNPVLSTDQNIYDQQGGFFKHNGETGTFYVQVMQLIRTAGKRNKRYKLQQTTQLFHSNSLKTCCERCGMYFKMICWRLIIC